MRVTSVFEMGGMIQSLQKLTIAMSKQVLVGRDIIGGTEARAASPLLVPNNMDAGVINQDPPSHLKNLRLRRRRKHWISPAVPAHRLRHAGCQLPAASLKT